MQVVDLKLVKIGDEVVVNRLGEQYKAIVLRCPIVVGGKISKDGFKPSQFKVQILGKSEYAGNRYVSYTAVHTQEIDEARTLRDRLEAISKAEKAQAKTAAMATKTVAKIERKMPKSLTPMQVIEFAKALETLDRLGYSVEELR